MVIRLVGWVVKEYVNDIYFQNYVNSLATVIVPVLGVALGKASASATTILYFDMRKPRHAEATDAIVEDSGGKTQSERHMRCSTLKGIKARQACNKSTSPSNQAEAAHGFCLDKKPCHPFLRRSKRPPKARPTSRV